MMSYNLADDEALARRLQLEEQSLPARRSTTHGSNHRENWMNRPISVEEQQNLEAARLYAQMDMRRESQHGHAMTSCLPHQRYSPAAQAPPSSGLRQRQRSSSWSSLCRSESSRSITSGEFAAIAAIGPEPVRGRDPISQYVNAMRDLQEHQSANRSNANSASRASTTSPSRRDQQRATTTNASRQRGGPGAAAAARAADVGGRDGCLAYARRLQEQAFSDLHTTSTQNQAAETTTHPRGGNEQQQLDDERLARLLQESGTSFRELTDEDLDRLLNAPGRNDERKPASASRSASPRPRRRSSSQRRHERSLSADSSPPPTSSAGGRSSTPTRLSPSGIQEEPAALGQIRSPQQRQRVPREVAQEPIPSPRRQSRESSSNRSSNPATPVGSAHRRAQFSEAARRALFPNPSSTPTSPTVAGYSGPPETPLAARSAPNTPLRVRANSTPDAAAVDSPIPFDVPGETAAQQPAPPSQTRDRKKRIRSFLGFGGRNNRNEASTDKKPPPVGAANSDKKPPPTITATCVAAPLDAPAPFPNQIPPLALGSQGGIPSAIPPPPGGSISARPGPFPHSVSVSRNMSQNMTHTGNSIHFPSSHRGCAVCGQSTGSFLHALEKRYHPECFRCSTCGERIDPSEPFAFTKDPRGEKQPHHRRCYQESFGINCAVCREKIPAGADGTVSFVKHPFFDKEQMCPRHAGNPGRRCTGCHRFEPDGAPFVDLNDAGRCVCYACCRSVIVDNNDVRPLWSKVISFFENHLMLPIWQDMREIPILVVGHDALNDQMRRGGNVHGGASQIMTRGLCLTDHDCVARLKLPSMRFNQSSSSFDPVDIGETGFTYFEVADVARQNPAANVFAILCLSGLPRDLTASVLAHEATHAWIKLHPKYSFRNSIPPHVEEGCAQLIAKLFLEDGLEPADTTTETEGPSDEKLRQYFKFSIETDDNEIYGLGYRLAAMAYSKIGIQELMEYIVRYRDFPQT